MTTQAQNSNNLREDAAKLEAAGMPEDAAKFRATATKIDDATIADKVVAFINRFVALPDERMADMAALWVIHTWTFDAAYATPYLYITSAEKQSGKTRFMEVLSELARNSIMAANVGSAVFRTIENARPSLFIDEVDTIYSGGKNEDLRGVLNSGYRHSGYALRFVPGKGGGDTEKFSTFCPKVLAGIDNANMPDTIRDRCITFTLKRKPAGAEVERFMIRKVEAEIEALTAEIREWAHANVDALMDIEPEIIEDISDRAFEIVEPLLAIAERIPGWHNRAREAAAHLLRGEVQTLSPQAQALIAARDWMDANGTDRIPSAVLADLVGVNTKKLGVILKPYEIRPTTGRMNTGSAPQKMYKRKDFEDAWGRYL